MSFAQVLPFYILLFCDRCCLTVRTKNDHLVPPIGRMRISSCVVFPGHNILRSVLWHLGFQATCAMCKRRRHMFGGFTWSWRAPPKHAVDVDPLIYSSYRHVLIKLRTTTNLYNVLIGLSCDITAPTFRNWRRKIL